MLHMQGRQMQLSRVDERAALTIPVALMHVRSVWCSIEPWPRSAALEQAMPLHSTPGTKERGCLCPIYKRRTALLAVQETEAPAECCGKGIDAARLNSATLETKVTLATVYGAAAASNRERQEPQELLSAHG